MLSEDPESVVSTGIIVSSDGLETPGSHNLALSAVFSVVTLTLFPWLYELI